GKQGDGTVLNGHLNGEPAADLAVIHIQRANLGLALGNGDVAWSVVAHEDHIVVEIAGVILCERTPDSEAIHYLHGLSVLDLVFTGHRYASCCSQTGSQNDGADGVFVLGITYTFIVVGKGS